MAVERISVRLPAGFDPRKHGTALIRKISETHGEGFEIDSIDPNTNTAQASRQVAITEVSNDTRAGSTKEVNLAAGTKLADGDKMAAKLEGANPGYMMTTFSPFTGKAILTKLDEPTARCRAAVAGALGVKPWGVQIRARADGGFDMDLPTAYTPSKHDKKLDEVATSVVGREGWYVHINPQKLTASIIPSDPPTFPALVPYNFAASIPKFAIGDESWAKIVLGVKLPKAGETDYKPFYLDLEAAPHCQVSGTSGSGKAQPLTSRIPVPVSNRFPTGWALMGELRSGDFVYAADGTTTEVADLTPVLVEDIYRVTFDDGQVVETTGEHLWTATTAAARHIRNRHGARNALRTCRLTDAATALREMALTTKAGDFARLSFLAEIAGVDDTYAAAIARTAGLRCEFVNVDTHFVGQTVSSTHLVWHYLAEDAFRVLDIPWRGASDPANGSWMTIRELAHLSLGHEPTKNDCRKTSRLLVSAQTPSKQRETSVVRRAGAGKVAVRTYPVGEFLYAVASAREAVVQPGASGSMMPLETVVNTAAMMETVLTRDSRREHNWALRMPDAFVGHDAELAIPPHLLGAWLGDGSSWSAQITVGNDDVEETTKLLRAQWPSLTSGRSKGKRAHVLGFPQPDFALCPHGHDDWTIPTSGYRYCRSCRRGVAPIGPTRRGLLVLLREAGVLQNKHIPAAYRRAGFEQRLALVQGLMDTDGSIDTNGSCELTLYNERLATDALEIIRSLGIKASMRASDATITQNSVRRIVGIRWRIAFTTTLPVFRLKRKVSRIKQSVRATTRYLYVTSIEKVASAPARCLHIDHPAHLYLTDGFVPTHNSVTLNAFIAGVLARGAELAVVDDKNKAVDFYWVRQFCRPGGWGGDSLAAAVTTMALIYEEGERRAKMCQTAGVTNWKDLPAGTAIKPIVVIVDELTALFFPEKVPKGLPKDHPLITEPTEINLQKATLEKWIKKTAAELRFVGIKLVLSSQVSSTNTGVDTSLRMNLANKILLGVNPTAGNRRLSLADAAAVPEIPTNIKADGAAGRGAGVAELEGQEPCVFKTAFATVDQYSAWLTKLGTPVTASPAPSAAQIAHHTPTLEADGPVTTTHGKPARDMLNDGTGAEWMTGENGELLSGYAKANAARSSATVQARA